jgi:hypothetical protein
MPVTIAFAGRHAERAAHEVEVLHGGDQRHVLDRPVTDLHRVGGAGLGARVAEPVGIAPLVAELQRIDRHVRQRHLLVTHFASKK